MLSYQADFKNVYASRILEFDEKYTENGKILLLSDEDSNNSEPIDIFDDSMVYEFFCHLDKNKDGLVSRRDFIRLLKSILLS